MAASSLSMAANATGTSFSSSSLRPHNPKSYYLLLDHHLYQNPIIFPRKARPLETSKFKAPFPLLSLLPILPRSFVCCASSAFDNLEEDQAEEQAEAQGNEQEEVADDEDDEDEEGVVSQSGEAGKLFVGNLPYSMTSSELSQIFEEVGRVIRTQIIYDKVTDRSRGFAFVSMGSVEEAKEAIRKFNESQVGGRTLKVNFPDVPRGGEREVMKPNIRNSNRAFIDTPHKIYAGNLSWALTSRQLRDAFENQPGFLSAKVLYDRDSGRSRGYGFVTFASAEELESALNTMDGIEIDGRPLRLSLATRKAPERSSPSALETMSESATESNEVLSSVSS